MELIARRAKALLQHAGAQHARTSACPAGMGKFGVPMNPEAYDGYTAEREQVQSVHGVA